MPTESSFADRMGRFVRLKKACETMSPVFAPVDVDIGLPALAALGVVLQGRCSQVSDAEADLKDVSAPRTELVKEIRQRVTRALNRVASHRAWGSKLPVVKAAADQVRGMKPPKPRRPAPGLNDGVPPGPDAGPAVATTARSGRAGQSCKDVEGYFQKFIGTLAKCPGYDTGVPAEISSAALATLLAALKTANTTVPEKEVALQDARAERKRVFDAKEPLPDGSASLRERWTRIKKAVASQYGRGSAEYALVAGIRG